MIIIANKNSKLVRQDYDYNCYQHISLEIMQIRMILINLYKNIRKSNKIYHFEISYYVVREIGCNIDYCFPGLPNWDREQRNFQGNVY